MSLPLVESLERNCRIECRTEGWAVSHSKTPQQNRNNTSSSRRSWVSLSTLTCCNTSGAEQHINLPKPKRPSQKAKGRRRRAARGEGPRSLGCGAGGRGGEREREGRARAACSGVRSARQRETRESEDGKR
jgi:hypothetical protein